MTALPEDGKRLLLGLVRDPDRPQATAILIQLLDAHGRQERAVAAARRAAGLPLFVSEYEGRAPTLRLTEQDAKDACEMDLKAEAVQPYWDWVEDEDGWIMREVNPDSGAAGRALGGRVTRSTVPK